ncbi:CSC1-like protein ERD4 isoform X2 [Nicotiana tabacum]|uniref:CSC1-like protein ERD4 isoform X2 n=1 Tax=Nicotiana tabacum TaxID=4097 RepID=A0A1S3ZIW1_TOBAC|nr:CSC1-like protein ERD4 isoform X2 [Nicotiana tomentosiformis]XP_016464415.1 PREDICTED: CSC1-like protein ERD4 isoform X2 [Nicotiana tabacum]
MDIIKVVLFLILRNQNFNFSPEFVDGLRSKCPKSVDRIRDVSRIWMGTAPKSKSRCNLALGIFVFSGIILLPVLLPVASTDHSIKAANTTSKGTFNELDRLSMGQVGNSGPRLWAFIVATYWVSVVTYYLLWKAYKHVSELRAKALMSPEIRADQFVILVRDIPPAAVGQSKKEQIDSFFRAIYPDTFYRSMVVTNNKEVNKIYEELEGYKKKLARAEAIYEESKKTNPDALKPSHKTGFLGIVGEKVDSIEFYNDKIKELIQQLEVEQKLTLKEKQQSSALVFFNKRVAAASASQNLHAPIVDRWTVIDAPEPRQLIWTNLPKTFYERIIRQYVVYVVVFLTIFFYMIPIGFISALTTLDNLVKLLPFLKPVVNQKAIKTVLEAYLPQLALIIFLALLPKFLMFLSKAEGIPSESHVTRAASGKYFYFSVLNVFIGVTLGGTLFSSFKSIENDPNSIFRVLAESLPQNATFFLTFVALKFFVGYGLELSRIVPLIIFHLKKKYLCKIEAEIKEAWAPGDLGYATRFPSDMLIMTIVLCYSVIAPIILPFGVVYFGLGWLLLRNQALKVYVPSFESYGRMWPHIHTRMLATLILYQVTMCGYFGVKKFAPTPVLFPLPIFSLIFAFICQKKFRRFFVSPALEVISHELKEVPNMDIVFRSFIPPCLSAGKSDDHQFEDALSHVSKTGSSSV